MRQLLANAVLCFLAACATPGPQSFTLTAAEIEQQIQVDLAALSETFRGSAAARPSVTMMPSSERVGVAWTVNFPDGPLGSTTTIVVQLSGRPALNPARNGVDLTQVRFDDLRVPGFLGLLSLSRFTDLTSAEQTLPDLPLIGLPESRLVQDHVAYGATGVSVGYRGLRVDIAPK